MVDQLVWTVTEAFAPTDRVLITIEGREFATGHNVYDRPMGRGDGTQSAVRLLIDTPAHGATVSSPVRVTGLAAAFEGTILWEVRGPDPNSGVVAEGVAQTDEGMTLVMSTHNLGQARRLAGRVLCLEGGHVVADLPTDRFFAGPLPEAAAHFLQEELP